jgi:hypothetical protein
MVVVSELGRMSGVARVVPDKHTDVEAVFVHNFYVATEAMEHHSCSSTYALSDIGSDFR